MTPRSRLGFTWSRPRSGTCGISPCAPSTFWPASIRSTLVFFEGGSRVAASLTDMAAVFGGRDAVVARELTKLHETIVRGPLDVLAADPRFAAPRGEIVVLVGPGAQRAATADE